MAGGFGSRRSAPPGVRRRGAADPARAVGAGGVPPGAAAGGVPPGAAAGGVRPAAAEGGVQPGATAEGLPLGDPAGDSAGEPSGARAVVAAGDRVATPSVRVRVGIGAAVVLVVVALVCSVLITALSPVGVTTTFGSDGDSRPSSSVDGATKPSASASPSVRDGAGGAADGTGGAGGAGASADGDSETAATLLVHVLGAVASPGVYELDEGARVFDAVAAAGGFADQADQASVNLARPLVDGEQLRVLAVGEAPPAAGAGAGGGAAGSSRDAGAGAGSGGAAPGVAPAAGAKVNLNAATELDLDGLPRIGPAMAARIIAWRTENGPFASVDDLLQVTGIGDKTLDGLRDLVTV